MDLSWMTARATGNPKVDPRCSDHRREASKRPPVQRQFKMDDREPSSRAGLSQYLRDSVRREFSSHESSMGTARSPQTRRARSCRCSLDSSIAQASSGFSDGRTQIQGAEGLLALSAGSFEWPKASLVDRQLLSKGRSRRRQVGKSVSSPRARRVAQREFWLVCDS